MRVADVPVPVIVTGYVPDGVLDPVVMVSVDEQPEVIEAGLNDAVAPAGRPLADSVTVWAEPLVTAVETVVETDDPGFTEPAEGEAPIEKSLPTGVLTASVHSA